MEQPPVAPPEKDPHSDPKRTDGYEITKPPEKWFRLFGLVVVTKTDLLAAAAFFLATSTAAYQAWDFLRGADVALYHPDTVYIYFDRYASRRIVVRFAGQVSLTNGGAIGRDAILRSLSVSILVGGRRFVEHWSSFVSVSRIGEQLAVRPKEAAHPIPVNGGAAISQMISFAPSTKNCALLARNSLATPCAPDDDFVSDDQFLQLIHGSDRVELTFTGTLFKSNRTVESRCTILVTEGLRQILPENDWFAVQCD